MGSTSGVINGALVLMLWLSKLVGVAPVSIKSADNGYRISISKFGVYYGYVVISVAYAARIGLIVLELNRTNSTTNNVSLYKNIMRTMYSFTNVIMIIAIISIGTIDGFKRMKTFIEFEQINKKHSVSTERKRVIVVLLYLIARFSAQVSTIYQTWINETKLFTILILNLNTVQFMLVSIFELQVIVMAFEVLKYFEAIEEEISRLHNDINTGKKNRTMLSDVTASIQALGKAYTVTCDIIVRYNAVNSLITLILFSLYTLQLTFTLNEFSNTFKFSDVRERVEKGFIQIFWFIFHVARALIIVEPWFQISKQVDKIKNHFAHIIREVTPAGSEMALEARVFYLQIMLNKPVLAPLGLFTITRSLLGQIVGIVATYQFVIIKS